MMLGPLALAQEPVEVKIGVLPGLKYDLPRFAVTPGAPVKIRLKNPDQMIHNLVVTEPGARMEVVMAALALGADGPAKDFVPDSPKVLFHTRALNPGESTELAFTAPMTEGVYPYVCTFTGHGMIMFGAMYVTTKPLPPLESDPNLPPVAAAITDASDHSHHMLERPVISRTFLPDCGPAAIAIGLPGGQSFCFDAGLCRLRYAWKGGFVDNTAHWSGKGENMGKVVGRIYYRAPEISPLRIGENSEPALRWKGYELHQGYPQLSYTVDGHPVKVTPRALAGGSGLKFDFAIDAGDQAVVRYVTDPEGGAIFSASAGRWEKGTLILSAPEAKHFTLTLTEKPGVEPLQYWSMNDLPLPGKKDPPAGVIGRAFTPGGTEPKLKVLETGLKVSDLANGGTVMAWYNLSGGKGEQPLFGAGEALMAGVLADPPGWHHYVSAFDAKHNGIYLDGQYVGTEDPPLQNAKPDDAITIGSNGPKSFLKGLIDEVRIYDRLLSPEEIRAIYAREAAHLRAQ